MNPTREPRSFITSPLGVSLSLVVQISPQIEYVVRVGPRDVLSIGRADTCDVPVAHPSVSRCHAILRLAGAPTIEDLGSRNGTIVKGRRLQKGERAEVPETFCVGEVVITLRASQSDDRSITATAEGLVARNV